MRRLRDAATILLLLHAVAANAQNGDSASANTVAAPPAPMRPIYGGWFGFAQHSPTNLFGTVAGREIAMAAMRIQRPFGGNDYVAWDYVVDLLPAVWVSRRDPGSPTNIPPCPRKGFGPCLLRGDIENASGVYGFGASPAGLQLRFRRKSTFQPFLDVGAGALWFFEPVPSAHSDRFNFMLGAGGGVLLARPGRVSVIAGYKLLHISNGGLGNSNPGLDNHLLYAGIARVPNGPRSATPHSVVAAEDAANSVVGSARVGFDARALVGMGPASSLTTSGSVMRFMNEHWQLGFSPEYYRFGTAGGTLHYARFTGATNLITGGPRWRGYVGGLLGGSGGSGQKGATLFGAQVGGLRFLAPTAALRTELRWRRSSYPDSYTTADAFLTIDSYLTGHDRPRALPEWGDVDVNGLLYASFRFERERRIDLTIAPFIASWAQVGARFERSSLLFANGRSSSGLFNGFARVYAPLSPRAMPFVHGFAEQSSYADASPDAAIASYGAIGGLRHYLNSGTALDVGVQWRRHTPITSFGARTRLPDETTLQGRVVTQLRWLRQ